MEVVTETQAKPLKIQGPSPRPRASNCGFEFCIPLLLSTFIPIFQNNGRFWTDLEIIGVWPIFMDVPVMSVNTGKTEIECYDGEIARCTTLWIVVFRKVSPSWNLECSWRLGDKRNEEISSRSDGRWLEMWRGFGRTPQFCHQLRLVPPHIPD